MRFEWLKQYLPRGLYGRAALILVLPVVLLQLIVSVVFVQRHFEGVTEQMTRNVGLDLRLILSSIDAAPVPSVEAAAAVAGPLQFDLRAVAPADIPASDSRLWYDFAGLVVARAVREELPGVLRVTLPDERTARFYLQSAAGPIEIGFDRGRLSASNPHQLLVNMVIFGALFTVIAFIYLRNQLRPITRLARAAEAFGRGRTVPYAPSGAVEVRAAGNAFLDMRARIERQIEQRTMMLSGVSHDLRTPLTRLRLGLALLPEDERAPLERDVDEMHQLIDAFLEFAQGDAHAGKAERTDPVALVTATVEDAARDGTAVSLVSVEGAGQVALRPVAMRRAIENLISNAVRYGTRCEVSVSLSDKSLRIRIEDDGPGIPPDQRENAVKPFVRLDPARNQDRGSGVGLGLAIAADIARAHGGVLRLGEARMGGLRADIVIAR